jgi:uncharacterized protein YpmB
VDDRRELTDNSRSIIIIIIIIIIIVFVGTTNTTHHHNHNPMETQWSNVMQYLWYRSCGFRVNFFLIIFTVAS